ncbi:MAG: hypothetical protein F2590_04880 [Actinobacteria bacterium]|uniref:Unannotated protein n=1 Tax=freshwater metagenome TaxID=449393 RepID=A0A6J6I5G0_9ZZZZ|nr:hypothetical protein [Actinomycetota bacterium]
MALFRRRRRLHAPLIDFGGLPNLADGIDDNLYLASAAKAAEIDFKSGAYDKFLFSEDGLRRMPYEVAIESHLALINQRLADAGRRQSLRREAAVLDLETKISKAEAKLARNDKQIENIESQIVYEESILSGLTQGIDNADWRDPKPQLASRLSVFMRIAAPIITLIVASLVDLAIIQASLDSIPGFKFVEAWMFTAPAVAMQVVFPHLIGLRLGRILRNAEGKLAKAVELSILLILWLAFAFGLTQLRMNFIVTQASNGGDGDITPELGRWLLTSSLLMLVALGGWLIFAASRHNPHESNFLKLNFALMNRKSAEIKLGAKVADYSNEIAALKQAEQTAIQAFEDAREAALNQLKQAALDIYRRALINHVGDSEFTSAYALGGDKK